MLHRSMQLSAGRYDHGRGRPHPRNALGRPRDGRRLKRSQELNNIQLIGWRKIVKFRDDRASLAGRKRGCGSLAGNWAMALDCVG